METTRIIGIKGEVIACRWLEKKGFRVLHRNYLKKWGEIDIVATKDNVLHFLEVKSVSKEKSAMHDYRPEENVHPRKVLRLRRVLQSYLHKYTYQLDTPFEFHVVLVYMNTVTRKARVEMLENIVL